MSNDIQRSRRRTGAEIEQMLNRCEQSQLTQAEFVKKEGICLATLTRHPKRAQTRVAAARFLPAQYRRRLELEISSGFCTQEVSQFAGTHFFLRQAMISLGAANRVFLACGITDMRKGYAGLYGLVKSQLEEDPLSGHLFVFVNRQRTRLKILYWDSTGLSICGK